MARRMALLALAGAAVLAVADDAPSCAAAGSALAAATAPVFTTACPSACPAYSLCVYFPRGATPQCVATAQRKCVFNGDACAFQCVPSALSTTAWFLTLFDRAGVVDQVDLWNSQWVPMRPFMESMPVNASQVPKWVGDVELPSRYTMFFVTGNEPATNIPVDSAFQQLQGGQSLPRGDVVRFELPASLLRGLERHIYVRIENVRFPNVSADDAAALSFPQLSQLYLRNSLLTTFPLANASISALKILDLSVNMIAELVPDMLPPSLDYLNVSWNELTAVANASLPSAVTTLDLSHNNIQTIGKGSLPTRIQHLALGSNLLSGIPADVAAMTDLKTLSLDGNTLREIPDDTLPSRGVPTLSLSNCSLVGIPNVLKSMGALTELSLARNDFSRNPDFSVLPKTLKALDLDDCQLQNLPKELQSLSSIARLSLKKNPRAVSDLGNLPASLRTLFLNDNALGEVPTQLRNTAIETLVVDANPLGRLTSGSLPQSLRNISMSKTSFGEISVGTLPPNLVQIQISDSLLTSTPQDLRAMLNLTKLTIARSKLASFDVGDAIENLQIVDLGNNRLTSFEGRTPRLVSLDLRQNAIDTFGVRDALLMQSLQLGDNNLTSFPDSVFQMPRLSMLNLTRNPIRNIVLTRSQVDSLAKIQTVVLAQEMFASGCEDSERMGVHDYTACPPPSESKKSWLWLVPVNIGVAVLLALLVFTFLRRRKLQKRNLHELEAQQAQLEKQQRNHDAAQIWTDSVLLQNRLDEDRVERTRLLGGGAHGEVWLVTYKHQQYALKQLKRTHDGDCEMDREPINAFVEEIKLLSSLSHPSVVSFVGVVWTKESDLGMVTEYMAGGDLRSYLDHHPKIYAGWTTQMVRVALQITEAIVYLHSLDPVVIHRDLKSRNVLLDTAMRAKLSDFGVSRYKLDDDTMTGGVGTVRWAAPEVLAGQAYDESADIYSLGVIMSEIDTHKLPFEDTVRVTDAEITSQLITGSLTVTVSRSCPPEIRTLVERCTVVDAMERPNGLQVAYELRMLLKNLEAS